MEFYQLARERYSVRRYAPRPVEEEKVERLLSMVQLTPTSVNYQPQHVYVIRSATAMERLQECTSFSYGAPLAFLMCYDRRRCWYHPVSGKPSGELDGSICLTHIMLQAAELGLGSLWVNGYDPQRLRRAFAIPEEYEDVAILFVGYPSEDSHPSRLHTQTRPLDEMVSIL